MGTDDNPVLEWLAENEAPEFVVDVFEGSKLRKQIQDLTRERDEFKPFKGLYESAQKAPARAEVAKELGFDTKNKTVSKALEGFDYEGEAPEKDALAAFLTDEWGLAPAQPTDQPAGEQPSGAQLMAAAQGGMPLGQPISTTSETEKQLAAAEAILSNPEATIEQRQQAASAATRLKTQSQLEAAGLA